MKTIPSPQAPAIPAANEHSVLVLNEVNGASTLFKMEVEQDRRFRKPPAVASDNDEAKRLVFSLTGATLPQGKTDAAKSHVAYGILPIKPDPTSAHYSCHLVNSGQLYPQNAWTAGPWNMPPTAGGAATGILALLATAEGEVLEVRAGAAPTVWTQAQLKANPEVWRLLRNGCVVGMVPVDGEANVLFPLINMATFMAPPPGAAVPSDLQGTWDFKWPKGSLIKVRIDPPNANGPTASGWVAQAPQLDDQRATAAVAKVKQLAQLWLDNPQDPNANNPGQLTLVFVPAFSDNYDVLINLDPLAAAGTIKAPQSALGTYAQRTPLNVPTSYCGHPEGLKQAADYYLSPAFTHIVLHELGHIFGLPHLHQNPEWQGSIVKQAYQAGPALHDAILQHVGLDVDEATLDADMRKRWPGKANAYADWLPLGGVAPGTFADRSIMMGHPIRGVLEGDPLTAAQLKFFAEPGAKDYEWLKHLYT